MAENEPMQIRVVTQPQNATIDQNASEDISEYIDILTLDKAKFIEETYEGSGAGYEEGRYLIPHPREVFYNTRRKSSYYTNTIKPIIDAMINPVFDHEIDRDKYIDEWSVFINNCDNAGTPLDVFLKSVIRSARMFGITFVVMDNVQEVGAITKTDAMASRILPYVYERKPYHLKQGDGLKVDRFGKIEEITFTDVGELENTQYYITWSDESVTRWHTVATKDGEAVVVDSETFHGLRVLPVYAVTDFSTQSGVQSMPFPPMYNLARLAYAIYNKESQIVQLEGTQTFSIFCVSGFQSNQISVGASNFLNISNDAKFMPQYATPSIAGLQELVKNSDRLREDMKTFARQVGVIGVTDQSGVSKSWDFRGEEEVLKETANAVERTDYALYELFCRYFGTSADGYEVECEKHYAPNRDEVELNKWLSIIREMPPKNIANIAWKQIAKLELSEEEYAEFDELEKMKAMPNGEGAIVPPEIEDDTEAKTETDSEELPDIELER